jgi:hypothetical protein
MYPRVITAAQIGSEYPWDEDSPVVFSDDERGKVDIVIPRHITWAAHHAQALRGVSPDMLLMGPGQGSFDLDSSGEIIAAIQKQPELYGVINWSDYGGEEGIQDLIKSAGDIPKALERKLRSIAKRYGENIRRILTDPSLRGPKGESFGAGVAAFAEDQINAIELLGPELGTKFNQAVYRGQFAAAYAAGAIIEATHAREAIPVSDTRRVLMARFPLIDIEYGEGTSLLGMADYHTGAPRTVYTAYELIGQNIGQRVISASDKRTPINHLVTEGNNGTNVLLVNQSLETQRAAIKLPDSMTSGKAQIRSVIDGKTEISERVLLHQGQVNITMEPLAIKSITI